VLAVVVEALDNGVGVLRIDEKLLMMSVLDMVTIFKWPKRSYSALCSHLHKPSIHRGFHLNMIEPLSDRRWFRKLLILLGTTHELCVVVLGSNLNYCRSNS